eukprot:8778271-Lingulodinium_polyedra.AAC.1
MTGRVSGPCCDALAHGREPIAPLWAEGARPLEVRDRLRCPTVRLSRRGLRHGLERRGGVLLEARQ